MRYTFKCRVAMPALSFCLGACLVILSGQAGENETGKIVEANGFKLVDAQGRMRGAWSVAEDEAVLYMYDKSLQQRVSIRVGDNPLIRILDGEGPGQRIAMQVSQHPLDGVRMTFFDQVGVERLVMSATKSASSIRVLDSRQQTRLSLRCTPDETAAIEVADGRDNIVWIVKSDGIKAVNDPN